MWLVYSTTITIDRVGLTVTSITSMSNTVHDRILPNEEETAAERCSEKLVDLVVLLTTKLDNNVEDLRKELTDNINENIERFEKVQQQQEEEYGKLCLQLQLCNEENDRLNKMLGTYISVFYNM